MSNSFGAKGNSHRHPTSGQSDGGGGQDHRALGTAAGGLGGASGGASGSGSGQGELRASESGGGGSATIKRRVARNPEVRRGGGESGERQDTFDELVASARAAPQASQLESGGSKSTASGVKKVASGLPAGSLSGGRVVSAGGTTSNTQRLSSIEILNENRQRQLQLEQQESFKQHLEQRQRFIQQQQRQERLAQQASAASPLADELDSCSAYRVDTSAPEYARMAAAAAKAAAQQQQQVASGQQRKLAGGAVNPFYEEPPAATVSGPSGFLSALMGGEQAAGGGGLDGAGSSKQLAEELAAGSGGEEDAESSNGRSPHEHPASRYSKLAAQTGASSYNYDRTTGAGGDGRPFYQKDLATLLGECRGSRKLVILIVAVALLLDNMLLTTVVPIIPAYLYKLRVVREHRELLGRNASGAAGSKPGGARLSGALDTNRDGRVDEEELQAELDRRINQSLANAQDRFSGSFFHPRVLKPRDKFGNIIEADDDADEDADDDDDDQAAVEDDASAMGRAGRRRARYPRAEAAAAAGRKPPGGAAKTVNMDEEYETNDGDDDDDDDDGKGDNNAKNDDDDDDKDAGDNRTRINSKNGKMDREKGPRPTSGQQRPAAAAAPRAQVASTNRPASLTSGAGRSASSRPAASKDAAAAQAGARRAGSDRKDEDGDNNNDQEQEEKEDDDNDENDDDEDSMATRKWNKLRSALREMAARSGNDSEALGGMCVSMALERPAYFNRRGAASTTARSRGGGGRARAKGNSAANEDEDEDDDDDDANNEGAEGDRKKVRPRLGDPNARPTPRRLPGGQPRARAKVERLRPGPRTATKGAEEAAAGARAGDTGTATIGDDEVVINHQDIVDESFEVGVMFASKPIVQALANPFVGAITNRVGFTLPMFLGFTIMFLSTIVFAFGETYATLFMARAIQGVGSACTSVAGMSMIADRFPDDAERGNAMAVALGGLALGVVIGPPFGGFMYEFFGKPTPFIVLAILALLDGLLQLLVLQPRVSKCQDEGASLLTLIKDPYILVAAGAITFANTGIGILEPALPLWMMDTMQAKNWEQGVAFLPAALSYLFSTNLFGNLGLRIGRWRSAMLGLIIIGCSLLLIPFASRVDHLILPNGAIGFAIGMVDSTMMPMLGYLVDIRHTSVYGSVYAIGDVAFCASFVFGPALSGTLVELIGFEGLIITTALICFAFAPLLVLLRDPPIRQVNEAQLQEQSTLRYVNYNHLDSPDEEAQLAAAGNNPIKSAAPNASGAKSHAR